MATIFLDLETFSELPINVGTSNYAANSEILLAAWAVDDEPVRVAEPDEDAYVDFLEALNEADEIVAHNAWFDRNILEAHKHYTVLEKWRCTMAQAYAHSLPGGLDTLGDVFGLKEDERKRKDGKTLIHLFCKPRPANQTLRRATKETHPEEWARFVLYARQDVEAMRILARKMPNWNYTGRELDLWHLDQQINERGFAVDRDLAHAAIRAIDAEKKRLADESYVLTAGNVEQATQRDRLLAYVLEAHGVDLPDMQGSTLERRLDDPDVPEAVKELIRVRLQASTSSTSKWETLVRMVSPDGRLRGTLQFCGAARTGRFAHRGFQPGNLPRPTMKQAAIDDGIDALLAGCVELVTDRIMELCSNALRGAIVAPLGKKLLVSDLSNIEGRGISWLAGEEWKLQAFRDYDAKIGADLYRLAYARTFGIPVDQVDDLMRQIGKVLELSMGYGGGVGAFVTMAAGYGLDLEALANKAFPALPDWARKEAEDFLAWLYVGAAKKVDARIKLGKLDASEREAACEAEREKARFGLTTRVFVTCDALKRAWRRAHPAIVEFWETLEKACKHVILSEPGAALIVGQLKVDRWKSWLRVQLPSGRYLCYPSPRVEPSGTITYMGVNPKSRKWQRLKTYGGKLAENATQAFARDVMTHNMPDIENAGAAILLTVHDEVITEVPDAPETTPEWLSSKLARVPAWAPGLPLAAAGFETHRYRKH